MTGQPLVHPKSFKRLQDKPRTVFYRARGGSLFRTIRVLNAILRGWRQYFKLDTRKGVFEAGSVRISVSGEVIPGAAQRGCPLYLRCSMPDLMR